MTDVGDHALHRFVEVCRSCGRSNIVFGMARRGRSSFEDDVKLCVQEFCATVFLTARFVSCTGPVSDPVSSCEVISGHLSCSFGGLLNLPALFALADSHLFSVIYAALRCGVIGSFASYGAPRMHQTRFLFQKSRLSVLGARHSTPGTLSLTSNY